MIRKFFGVRPTGALLAISLLAAIGSYACSSQDSGSSASAVGATDGELTILFGPMYSAYDGTHTFKVPAKVQGVTKVKWSVSDTSIVDVSPQADGTVVFETLKAGTVQVTAAAGGIKGQTTLTITSATPDEWEAGNQRYNNGIVLQRGRPEDGGAKQTQEERQQAACTNCHGHEGGSDGDIEHTPTQTAGYSDDELITIFTQGVKPAGVPMRTGITADRYKKIHNWQMDEFAVKGLVVYLRALEPKSQGEIDFGGGWGGKGKGNGGGNGNGGGKKDAGAGDAGAN